MEDDQTKLFSTSEAAKKLGTTQRKVKYYCGLGLVPGIKRTMKNCRPKLTSWSAKLPG